MGFPGRENILAQISALFSTQIKVQSDDYVVC